MSRLPIYAVPMLAGALLLSPIEAFQPGAYGAKQTPTAAPTVEKIADNPSSWFGKKVTVKAKVGDVFSKKVFNLEEEGIVDVDDEVLVVALKHSMYLNPDQLVTVTGTVRSFVKTDIERTYDGLDWDLVPELLVQFERRPVIVAESVTAGPLR